MSFIKAIFSIEKILGLLKWFTEGISSIFKYFKAKNRREEVDETVEEAENAKTPEEKRNAACRLERLHNPDADCD